MAGTLGGSAGLMMESWIYVTVGNHWRAVSLLMLASVAAALTVAIFFRRPRAASSIRFPLSAAAYRAAIAAASRRKRPDWTFGDSRAIDIRKTPTSSVKS